MDEDPRVFGLHSNAVITAQTSTAKIFMNAIISVQPRLVSGGAGKKPEEIASEMADDFLQQMPGSMREKNAHPETYKVDANSSSGGVVSLGVFHGQERDRFNKLTGTLKSTLGLLGKAIKGLVVMNADMEDMYNKFLIQQIPGKWVKDAYPCLKPLNSWFADYLLRMNFMIGWLHEGPPISFWVPAFFFPQGFMTASMQLHARSTKIPIDTLVWMTNPTNIASAAEVTKSPDTGMNVHGLFIQGCGWEVEKGMLKESDKAVLFVEMPVIWLEPLLTEHRDKLLGDKYITPMYKTSERRGVLSTTGHSTNFVMYMHLCRSDMEQAHWVRRGVALLCMLDD